MVRDYSELVRRVALWHAGMVTGPSYYDAYVTGRVIHGGVQEPVRFHTYACLYPDRGTYVVCNTGAWSGCSISPLEVRRIITEFDPPDTQVRAQREVAREYVSLTDDDALWRHAIGRAAAFNLPVVFMAFGHTARDNVLSVYQRSVVTAPLRKVAAELKRTVPRFEGN